MKLLNAHLIPHLQDFLVFLWDWEEIKKWPRITQYKILYKSVCHRYQIMVSVGFVKNILKSLTTHLWVFQWNFSFVLADVRKKRNIQSGISAEDWEGSSRKVGAREGKFNSIADNQKKHENNKIAQSLGSRFGCAERRKKVFRREILRNLSLSLHEW